MNKVFEWTVANKDLITSWTAIFAVLATIVNMVMQRGHNRKSVLPIGHISVGDYENRIFVRLWNHGVGPLIIKRVVVSRNNDDQSKPAIIDFMPDLPGYHWSTFVGDVSGRTISAEDHITLVLLEGDEENREFVAARQMTRRMLSQLTVKAEYKDVYGKSMPAAVRSLEWFGRNLEEDT